MLKLKKKNGKNSLAFYLVWAAPGIASASIVLLLNQVTFFATDVLGLPAALVGVMLLVAKLFDGVTDIIGGYIIDKTNTRWGKARPYDFTYVLFAVFTLMLFSLKNIGTVPTAILLFVLYTLIFSVCQTLYSLAANVYLSRAVETSQDQVSVTSISGFVAALIAMGVGIALPQMIDTFGQTVEGWRVIAASICIPAIVLSLIRVFLIPEIQDSAKNAAAQTKLTVKESAKLLFSNSYLLIFSLSLLITNIGVNLTNNVQTFYFKYIVGDISAMTFVTLCSIAGPLTIALYPVATRKMGIRNLLIVTLLLGFAGRLLPIFGTTSMPLLLISALLFGVSYMPSYILSSNIVIDCMDYGEYKSGIRAEGIYACINGFCSKVGTGLASGVLGIVTALGGYDASLAVQSSSANLVFVLLYTAIPAAFLLIAALVMKPYKLDKELPMIQETLRQRRGETSEK